MKSSLRDEQNASIVSGNLFYSIVIISWPMLVIMLLNFLVGFTDIYVAGLLTHEVQAAVGFITQLYFLLIILGNAISTGTIALVSRNVGANNFSNAIKNATGKRFFNLPFNLEELVLQRKLYPEDLIRGSD